MKAILTFICVMILSISSAQQTSIDSLKQELATAREDSVKVLLFKELSSAYAFSKPDSAFYYASEGLQLARKINYANGEAWNLFWLATHFRIKGASSQGMQFAMKALPIFKKLNNLEGIIQCTNMLGWTAFDQKDYRLALEYAFHTARLSEKYNNYRVVYSYSTIAECYEQLNKLDSALIYAEKAESMSQDYNWNLIVLRGIHARLNHDNL